jgi:chromosomal replication initiator protein
MDAEQIWDRVSENLRQQVSDAVWNSTFHDIIAVGTEGDSLVLAVPSQLLRQRIEQRYQGLLDAVLEDAGHPGWKTVFEVSTIRIDLAGEAATQDRNGSGTVRDWQPPTQDRQGGTVPDSMGPDSMGPDSMNRDSRGDGEVDGQSPELSGIRRYNFDTFVTGPSNRFAHAAAQRVAETPGRSYNPLFVYGDAGLGKTHLLQSIASYVAENYPGYRVRYISLETMMNEFVESIRKSTQPEFKRRYRDIDVLLVDDIQFMEGKEQLQEEFFHTFNTLHHSERQIVLSSDRPPDAIATLEDRLRSRFKMGLITDIQPPDFETRLAILQKKMGGSGSKVPPEVLEFIATNITFNIRELEGALIRVEAYAGLYETDLTVSLAEEILGDMLASNKDQPITAGRILEITCNMFNVTLEALQGRSRARDLVHARQISMYVCRELTDLSYPQIGKEFGDRDHTTVIHAYDKISNQIKDKRETYEEVTSLIQRVRSGDR